MCPACHAVGSESLSINPHTSSYSSGTPSTSVRAFWYLGTSLLTMSSEICSNLIYLAILLKLPLTRPPSLKPSQYCLLLCNASVLSGPLLQGGDLILGSKNESLHFCLQRTLRLVSLY